ncbi:PCC domain-containing protein [Mesorhizobium amorphae]|uniref:PCC domain-containing protein n=1 Tax=Mesorhizobium amorphae TaxID=71433 RepID=UPI003F506B16
MGWFDLEEADYRRIPILEHCEVSSAIGEVATGDDGKPSLHVHAVLGMRDGSMRGGHLLERPRSAEAGGRSARDARGPSAPEASGPWHRLDRSGCIKSRPGHKLSGSCLSGLSSPPVLRVRKTPKKLPNATKSYP